ncbi:MAG: MerR family transcriptional regulator [Pseudomonadota bacterium]
MKISEAAERSGLSIDTIRFYEKRGMLPDIARGPDGHRRFTPHDVDWLTLLFWLRETGMPLSAIRRFTHLAKATSGADGDAGLAERRQILLDHRDVLAKKRAMLSRCEEVLSVKLAQYGDPAEENQ